MRTNKIIAIAAIAILGATAFVACNKIEKTQSSSIVQPNLSAKSAMSLTPPFPVAEAGELHNNALALTEDYWGQGGNVWKTDSLLNYMRIKMTEKYPTYFGAISREDIKAIQKDGHVQELMLHARDADNGFIDYYHQDLQNQLNKGEISKELYAVLKKWSNPDLQYDDAYTILNRADLSSFSKKEQNVILTVKSVFASSHSYWNKYGATHARVNATRKLSNGTIGNIVDAVVAIGLCETGPIGMFVAAAASSAWWD